ncbi:phage head-tail connector protein [Bacillus amyloliquefaciens]|uniref:phage head-tail connector protein n=1 Tax=Bacillus amyloliquefaciens TaxID=1390 RepID=UPI000E59A448|nr:phage head-tail connector protein [Bacillus amyloliquefaciens]MCM3248640.1 phage head-tail connector protein [Bacillus amyloliquefaciens]MCY7426968.1 phage head-tail connector protein [Bacillus amyloliquefaciens]MEC0966037.1 phage head-tail connector protein [Bacillus amyloliquefaciens]MEC1013065.1 phage head-tail connector protein [Bacillus amyloliquefaciens]MEC2264351.1 phage head-tail connector protein [Bacillus amyloliquefaciens]
MDLSELKIRLGIPEGDTSQDAKLQIDLEDAISFVKEECNNSFVGPDGVESLPGPVKKGIALMIEIDRDSPKGVQSESIGGMSKTYMADDVRYKPAFDFFRPYKKIRFKPLR